MIDWIQIWITDDFTLKKHWENPMLYFRNEIQKRNDQTGEIYGKQTKEFEGITFRKEPHLPKNENEGKERLIIGFKPHYWHNGNKHNANDYTPLQCIETIKRFIVLFRITDYNNFPINNLEYGLNFIINGYGKELIGFDSYHSRNQFIQDENLKFSKKAKRFSPKTGKPEKYLTSKFYSKGFQFPEHCPEETLRFEISTKKSKRINQLGIYNIGDLLKIEVYDRARADILAIAKNILIIDQKPIFDNLNEREKNQLIKYSNSSFWYDAINQNRKHSFNEKKTAYFKYLDKTGHNINQKFYQTIEQKLNFLFEQKGNYSPPLTKQKNGNYSPLDNMGLFTDEVFRICPITGKDITMQKHGSNLLSNTGLKHLERTDKKEFENLRSILLTGRHNEYERTVYDQISKQIRNRYYNNYAQHYPEQTELF